MSDVCTHTLFHPRVTIPSEQHSSISKRSRLMPSDIESLVSHCVVRNNTSLVTDCCILVCEYVAITKQALALISELHVFDTETYNLLVNYVSVRHVLFHDIDIRQTIPGNPQVEFITMDTCDKNYADYYARREVFPDMIQLHLHRTPLRWAEHIPRLCEEGVQVLVSGCHPICLQLHKPYPPFVTLFQENCVESCCDQHRPMANENRLIDPSLRGCVIIWCC